MNTTVTKFKTTIDLMPKHSGDLNILFSVSYAEYKAYVKTLEVLLLAQSFLKPAIEDGAKKLDTAAYGAITKGTALLNNVLKSTLPPPFNKNIDVKVGAMGDLLAVACTDYFGSIPESLFNTFQDIKHGINKWAVSPLDKGLFNSIARDLLAAKDEALQDIVGSDIFTTILSPLVAYESFLKENGVDDIIKRMQRLERCMTKPGVGGRKKSDFIHPTAKKLYSAYYKSLFMINSKGKLNVSVLGGTSKNKSQLNNVMQTVTKFRIID